MAIIYEWVVEELDSNGEIDDVSFFDSFSEALEHYSRFGGRMGLSKAKSNKDIDSVDYVVYAYFVDGVLESQFDDGSSVPTKYLKESTK